MEAQNNASFLFHIKKQPLRNKKYFIYHNKEYPIDYDLLKKNSNYFFNNQAQFEDSQYIELVDEKEEYINFSDESIQAFISCCQNEPCSIHSSSVIPLQYLANKYEFSELIEVTEKFISQHSSELVFPTLLFKISKNKSNFQKKNAFFDTSKEENLISDHLNDYIQKDEMLSLPVPVLYRIFNRFYSNKPNNEMISDMTNFLFKCLDKYGKSASVLFNVVDFKEEKFEVFNHLLHDYSTIFDFNMINLTLTKTTEKLTSDFSMQQEKYSELFLQMKKTFEEQLSELNQMKKDQKEKQAQDDLKNQEMMNKFLDEINKIKDDVGKQMQKMEGKFDEICKRQEEIIDKGIVNKYHRIILNTITVGQFIRFDDNLKEHFIMEVFKNTSKQYNQKNINRCILYFKYTDLTKYEHDHPIIQFIKDDNYLKITNNKIEHLHEERLLSSALNDCLNSFDDFTIEMSYPCKNFNEIMKEIFDIKSINDKQSNKMKVSLNISKNDYFEQKYQWNKIVNECKIGGEVKSINKNYFSDFSNLSDIQLSNEITNIEDFSFKGCSLLKQISIPTSVTSIGNGLFEDCSSLTKITIPTSVTHIGENCFNNCSKLEQVTIDPFCTQIEGSSFNNCKSLNNFKFLSGNQSSNSNNKIFISHIMTENFYNLRILNSPDFSLRIENFSVIEIEIKYPSENFSKIIDNVKRIKESHQSKVKIGIFYSGMETTDKQFCNNKDINFIRFDTNVLKTPNEENDTSDGAFQNCTSLEKIIIPSSFTKIGKRTFLGCTSLKQISFANPSSLSQIGNNAFYNCHSMTQITIPSSVTSICYYAFGSCTSLTQITIPPSVKSIDKYVFNNCTSLTQITIPSSVKFIDNHAFQYCSSLIQINIPSSVTTINESIFENCTSLTQVTIPSSITSIGSRAFFNCTSLSQVTIPLSVKSIGQSAFYNCTSLTQITIPSSVESMDQYAFSYCKSLTQATIPSSITSIQGTFSGCESLTQITIPSSVTTIDECAFYCCKSLKQITIPSSVKSIGKSAFNLCESLTEITIPSSVTIIGDYAFGCCKSLTQITIPSSVTTIGNGAFKYCDSLTKIELPASVTSVGKDAFYNYGSTLKQITLPSNIDTSNLGLRSSVTINRI